MEKIIDYALVDYVFCKICSNALKKNKSAEFNKEFYNYLNENIGYMTIKNWSKYMTEVVIMHKQFGDILQQSVTSGKCYYYALLLARNLPNCSLAKGELRKLKFSYTDGTTQNFDHSWVEINTPDGNFVIDTTARQIFNRDYYYEKFDVCPHEIYSHGQLLNDELFFKLGVYATNWRRELCEDFAILTLDYYKQNTKHCKDIIKNHNIYKETKEMLNISFEKMQTVEKNEIYDVDDLYISEAN